MRNIIPCTAGRIALLEPSMIQSIVEQKAYQRGHEYFKESRVRLLEADETDIAATVRGNSGVYEQTVRLREGNLVTVCSCTLIEQPMCRHCVAVLLEYHRWSSQRGRRDTSPPRDLRTERNDKDLRHREASNNHKPAVTIDQDMRLSDVIAFVEWAQPAMRSLARNQSLPEAPHLGSGIIAEWVRTIGDLHQKQREHEDVTQALHADLAQRDLQVEELRQQLKASEQEVNASNQACRRLEEEVASYQAVIGKLRDLTKSIGRFDAGVKTVAGDLSKSQGQLEQLAQSFREVSQSLQDLAKTRAS